jgi:tetratricopeptide (TPR) repeat protein/DNA-binding SARP family transcriptional activator
MEFNILGPLEVRMPGQRLVLQRAKEKCLLAILLIAPNKSHKIETLIDQVWDNDEAVEGTCRSYLSRVGDVVAAADCGARLETGRGIYLLRVDPGQIDLHCFRRLRDKADVIARGGDAEHAVALLQEAERLWRGPALAGLPGRRIDAMRVSLETEHRIATFRRFELELTLGRHKEITSELQQWSSQDPLDETPIAYQMVALYRSGRQVDALSLYQEARKRLRGLGMEPTPSLSVLQQRILSNDRDLAVIPTRRRQSPRPQPYSLPSLTTAFVGRSDEILALTSEDQPARQQVRVIEGMSGIGKTTLAIHVARQLGERYPDGQIYLKFNAHQAGEVPLHAAEALSRLLEMVGVTSAPTPRSLQELTALWQSELSSRRSVIVLDDVPDLDAISPILPETGNCITLITTQRHLPDIPGSFVISLDVLPEHDAISLFTQIVGPEKANDRGAIAKVVRLCGCLPLAIEVTARRLRDEGDPSTISEFIREIISLHSLPDRIDAVSPQLVSAFQLSYEGLTTDQKIFFSLLGVNPCVDFTVYSAAAITGNTVSGAEAMITVLADRYLVEHAARRRLRLHDLVRSFAAFTAERDHSQAERQHAERGLLEYYIFAVDRADRLLYPYRRRKRIQPRLASISPDMNSRNDAEGWLNSEWSNIVRMTEHAMRHGWQRRGADLIHMLAEFMQATGRWAEAVRLHSLALQTCREIGDSRRLADAALDASLTTRERGQHDLALRLADEALNVYRSLGDHNGEATAIDRIGTIHAKSSKPREALAHFREAVKRYRETGNKGGQAEAGVHAAISHLHLSQFPEAAEELKNSLRIFRATKNRRGEAKALLNVGFMQEKLGHHGSALRSYHQSLDIYRAIGFRHSQALLNQNIGNIYQYQGHYEAALAAYRNALRTYRNAGDLRLQGAAFHDIGETYYRLGRYEKSLDYYEKAKSIAQQIGDSQVMLITLRDIAATEQARGNNDDAQSIYSEALGMARELGDRHEEGKILAGIAESVSRFNGLYEARIYWQLALEIFLELGVPEARLAQRHLDALNDPA